MSAGIIASQAFVPNKIDSLVLWLDATDLGTIIESGGAVSEWRDKSGNGNHATQFTGSAQPLTGVNSLNGKNVIAFDGADDFLIVTPFATTINLTIILAVNVLSVNGVNSGLLSLNTLGSPGDGQIEGGLGSMFLARFNSTSLGSTSFPLSPSNLLNIPSIINYRLSANDSDTVLRVSGVQEDTDTYNGGLASSHNLRLGINRGVTLPMEVDMAEVIIYNRDLALSEMIAVETYLMNKWGI